MIVLTDHLEKFQPVRRKRQCILVECLASSRSYYLRGVIWTRIWVNYWLLRGCLKVLHDSWWLTVSHSFFILFIFWYICFHFYDSLSFKFVRLFFVRSVPGFLLVIFSIFLFLLYYSTFGSLKQIIYRLLLSLTKTLYIFPDNHRKCIILSKMIVRRPLKRLITSGTRDKKSWHFKTDLL